MYEFEYRIFDHTDLIFRILFLILFNNSKFSFAYTVYNKYDHNTFIPEKMFSALLQPANPIFVELQRK